MSGVSESMEEKIRAYERKREYDREYYQANKEERKAHQREYTKANPEKINASQG